MVTFEGAFELPVTSCKQHKHIYIMTYIHTCMVHVVKDILIEYMYLITKKF